MNQMTQSRNSIIASILERFRRGGNVLIVSHISPDGDSIGSQLALSELVRKLGCNPTIVNHDTAFPKYAFLTKHGQVNVYSPEETYPKFDFAVILEAPDLDRIGNVRKLLVPGCEILNIDHHPGNTQYGNLNLVDESVAAVGILVYELFQAAGVAIDSDIADELFTAILTDTGRFRFGSTNPQAMRVCAGLLENGASTKKISDALYASYAANQLRMLGELLANMELHHDGKSCLLLSDQRIRAKYVNGADEMEGLSEYTLFTTGVKIGALLREVEAGRTKISLRCHEDFDVAAIAAVHGGGGHRNAAGCTIALPFLEAKSRILEQIGEALTV
jgi:phosphoesterase RecJ-like protein